jgi:photosystem II stability/assembly factor-like uncharacterized protein
VPLPLKLRTLAAPVLLVGLLQLSGCTARPGSVPPGGTYLSFSAGAHFDQSVALVGEDGNIARFSLRRAHRPPHASDHIYIAAGNRGIVVSRDGGVGWSVIAPPLASVQDVAVLSNNLIIAAGSDADGRGFILRSADEGKSWEVVLTVPVPVDTRQFQLFSSEQVSSVVLSLAIDPFNPQRLYAGSNLGTLLVGEQLGKTWRTIHTVESNRFDPTGTRQNLGIRTLKVSPHRPEEFFLITFDRSLYRVAGGEQVKLNIPQYLGVTPPFGAGLGQTRDVLDIAFFADQPAALLAATAEGAALSSDLGVSWQVLPLPIETTPTQGFNAAIAAVSPSNSQRLLITFNSVLYRSEDGGQSWNTFDFHLPNHVITNLLINPVNPAQVLAVTAPLTN